MENKKIIATVDSKLHKELRHKILDDKDEAVTSINSWVSKQIKEYLKE